MATSMYKRVTSHGSISVPVALRREMGVQPGDTMEIKLNDDNTIAILPYQARCIFCAAQEDIKVYRNRGVCPECFKTLQGKMEGK